MGNQKARRRTQLVSNRSVFGGEEPALSRYMRSAFRAAAMAASVLITAASPSSANVTGTWTTTASGGSATANVLLGSAGNDTLMGGGGRDVLIGGVGADVLQAGVGASLLIADQTTYDGNPLALARLAEEWNSPLLYLARVSNLSGLSIGANTPFALTRETVRSDASVDLLFGAAGLDWFLLTGRGPAIDWFGGFAVGEEVTWL